VFSFTCAASADSADSVVTSSATAAAVTSAVACFAAKGKMLWQLLDAS
jgi:hypothetical protein